MDFPQKFQVLATSKRARTFFQSHSTISRSLLILFVIFESSLQFFFMQTPLEIGNRRKLSMMIQTLILFFFVMIVWSYLATCFIDSSIISKNKPATNGDTNQLVFPVNHCKKCQNWKPPRTHHCSVCNKCVLKMDHHCPWVANCIGLRNFRAFWDFCLYVALCSALWLGQFAHYVIALLVEVINDGEHKEELLNGPVVFCMIFCSGPILFFGFGTSILVFGHFVLASNNSTTLQNFKLGYPPRYPCLPDTTRKLSSFTGLYDMGHLKNLLEIFGGWKILLPLPNDEEFGGYSFWRLPYNPNELKDDDGKLRKIKKQRQLFLTKEQNDQNFEMAKAYLAQGDSIFQGWTILAENESHFIPVLIRESSDNEIIESHAAETEIQMNKGENMQRAPVDDSEEPNE